jgi:hypothetical protein
VTDISKLSAGKAPRKGAKEQPALPGFGRYKRTCPECSERFTTDGKDRAFCTDAHKAAFHNRASKIGRGLVPLAQAWRAGRNAKGASPEAVALRKTAMAAFNQMCALLDHANGDDRKEGRQPKLVYVQNRQRKTGQITKALDSAWEADKKKARAGGQPIQGKALIEVFEPESEAAKAAEEFRHNGGPVIDDAEILRRAMAEGFGK